MKKTLLILVCLFSFLMFKYNAFAEDYYCDDFVKNYEILQMAGAVDTKLKQKFELVKYVCDNTSIKTCVQNAIPGECVGSCMIGDKTPFHDECFNCFTEKCIPEKSSNGFIHNFFSGATNNGVTSTSQENEATIKECKTYLKSSTFTSGWNVTDETANMLCSDPETYTCLKSSLENKCATECVPLSGEGWQYKCYNCMSGGCLAEDDYYALSVILFGTVQPGGGDPNSCQQSQGLNCEKCNTSRGICIKNCMVNHTIKDAECYAYCVKDGNTNIDELDFANEDCKNCLSSYCDYQEVQDFEYNYKDPDVDLTTGWDFCEKHGVLVSMRILNRTFSIAKIVIPILLIVFGIVELSKAVLSSDDKAISSATSSLTKKLIIGLLIFFIPTIIDVIFKSVDDYTKLEDNGCYTCFFDRDGCDSLIDNSNDD